MRLLLDFPKFRKHVRLVSTPEVYRVPNPPRPEGDGALDAAHLPGNRLPLWETRLAVQFHYQWDLPIVKSLRSSFLEDDPVESTFGCGLHDHGRVYVSVVEVCRGPVF